MQLCATSVCACVLHLGLARLSRHASHHRERVRERERETYTQASEDGAWARACSALLSPAFFLDSVVMFQMHLERLGYARWLGNFANGSRFECFQGCRAVDLMLQGSEPAARGSCRGSLRAHAARSVHQTWTWHVRHLPVSPPARRLTTSSLPQASTRASSATMPDLRAASGGAQPCVCGMHAHAYAES